MAIDLKELLNSEAAEIARKLDAVDGSYDGDISLSKLNTFLMENDFRPYKSTETTIPFIEAAKYIYNIKKEQQQEVPITVDFDPQEEMRKDRKRINHF